MNQGNKIRTEITLSVIIPAYNEEEVISEFHKRLSASLDKADINRAEIIYINDGSTDQTLPILMAFMAEDDRVQVIDLSRNFGKEAAMTAGLDAARGDAVVVIDADLQDPPELIPSMITEWRKGFDVVLMHRSSRRGETWMRKITARAFYRIIRKVSHVNIPENVGDFRLMSSRSVIALRRLTERTRFMKGLFAWVGYPTTEIPFHRDQRFSGVTKWNYMKLWNLALDGLTCFTIAPLKIASYVGGFTVLFCLGYGLVVLITALIRGTGAVPGHPSLMFALLFIGGLQLLAIGVVGEYLGRMFLETKQRPIYLINNHHMSLDKTDTIQDHH